MCILISMLWSAQELCSVGDDSFLILWDARTRSSPVVRWFLHLLLLGCLSSLCLLIVFEPVSLWLLMMLTVFTKGLNCEEHKGQPWSSNSPFRFHHQHNGFCNCWFLVNFLDVKFWIKKYRLCRCDYWILITILVITSRFFFAIFFQLVTTVWS